MIDKYKLGIKLYEKFRELRVDLFNWDPGPWHELLSKDKLLFEDMAEIAIKEVTSEGT